VLERISDNPDQLDALFELDGATNDRLIGAANLLTGVSVHELLFGVPHALIVNAAFCHARPGGGRFSSPERGAWYAAFDLDTARAEVAFHKAEELREIGWTEPEKFTFVDYRAGFQQRLPRHPAGSGTGGLPDSDQLQRVAAARSRTAGRGVRRHRVSQRAPPARDVPGLLPARVGHEREKREHGDAKIS
jgi:hypothetical protein